MPARTLPRAACCPRGPWDACRRRRGLERGQGGRPPLGDTGGTEPLVRSRTLTSAPGASGAGFTARRIRVHRSGRRHGHPQPCLPTLLLRKHRSESHLNNSWGSEVSRLLRSLTRMCVQAPPHGHARLHAHPHRTRACLCTQAGEGESPATPSLATPQPDPLGPHRLQEKEPRRENPADTETTGDRTQSRPGRLQGPAGSAGGRCTWRVGEGGCSPPAPCGCCARRWQFSGCSGVEPRGGRAGPVVGALDGQMHTGPVRVCTQPSPVRGRPRGREGGLSDPGLAPHDPVGLVRPRPARRALPCISDRGSRGSRRAGATGREQGAPFWGLLSSVAVTEGNHGSQQACPDQSRGGAPGTCASSSGGPGDTAALQCRCRKVSPRRRFNARCGAVSAEVQVGPAGRLPTRRESR